MKYFLIAILYFLLTGLVSVSTYSQVITTIAGNHSFGYSGDGGSATSAQLSFIGSVATDIAGNFYFGDNNVVRKVNITTGIITTVAGNGTAGYSGDGGLATVAKLHGIAGITLDGSNNLYIVDRSNQVVRKVTYATGIITTVAGTGSYGNSGDGAAATAAKLASPWGIAIDNAANIYIGDDGNRVVRKVTVSTGKISLVAGNYSSGFSGDGSLAINAQLSDAMGIAVDNSNNIYIADFSNNVIRKVTNSTGIITTFAGNATAGYSGDGSAAISAKLDHPQYVAVDNDANIYIDDRNNNVIRKVDHSSAVITTIAGNNTGAYSGDGGSATAASLYDPQGVAIDPSGNLYISDANNEVIRKVTNLYTWSGSLNSDWATAGNWSTWSINAVPSNSSTATIPQVSNQPVISSSTAAIINNLTIQNAAILNIATGATLNASGNITVNPGGSITGSYAGITGSVTLQQNIIAQRGWRMFSNPFSTTQTFASLSSSNNVTINTSAGPAGIADTRVFSNSGNAWADAGTTTAANTAYGLFIRGIKSDISGGGTGLTYAAGPTTFTYGVSGTLNGNSFTVPAANVSNFSLVGNPYAAPVNSQALTGGSVQSYYLYQIAVSGNGRTKAGSWSSVLTSNTTSPIPVMGVIAVKTAGNFSVATSDINTSNAAASGLFGIDTPIPHIELQVEQSGNYQDKLFVRLDPAATANGTDKIDLDKFYNENVSVYSISDDKSRLAVDARNVLNNIALGISALAGDYNFKLADDNLPQGTTVYLNDKYLNTQTALKAGDTYNFSVSTDAASYGEQRFELTFSSKITATASDPVGSLTANVLGNITSGNLIAVQIAGATTLVQIAIKDMNGKALGTINTSNGIQYINVGNTAKGMLLLQISDGKSSIIKKVMKL